MMQFGQVALGSKYLIKYNKQPSNPHSKNSNMDIIPGVYEGGYKVWQCTIDLIKYMGSSSDDSALHDKQIINFKGKRVMDIGCGHGLLGIAALKSGAELCCFQDFNQDVLQNITKTNILINGIQSSRCQFAYGDWSNLKFQNSLNSKFDIILGSELIYKQQNYNKIIEICTKYLQQSEGIAVLANKSYYFGVGGNVDDFKEAIQKYNNQKMKDNRLVYETLLEIVPAKGGNKKQITLLKFENNIHVQNEIIQNTNINTHEQAHMNIQQ